MTPAGDLVTELWSRMSAKTYAGLLYVALIFYVLGIRYDRFYIIVILAAIAQPLITNKRGKVTGMARAARAATALFTYSVATFGFFLMNMGKIAHTIPNKILIGSGVWAFGFALIAWAALINASWYVNSKSRP